MEIFESSPSHVSTKYSLKVISCGNSSVGHTSKPSPPHGHQLDGDEIVNAPLSCYIVKWRNRKVAIMGLVQLSNLKGTKREILRAMHMKELIQSNHSER